jgi:anti-anti-sigma regulatory factor
LNRPAHSAIRKKEPAVKIETRRVGDVVVFEIEGAFTPQERSRPRLDELVEEQLGGGARKVLIDMRKATPLGDVAVADVLGAYVKVQNAGGRFKVVVSHEAYRLYTQVMVDKVVELHDSVESAMKAFGPATADPNRES